MLHAYVYDQANWECHLPLVLHAYRTAVHTSSSFELMYGRFPQRSPFPASSANEPSSYQSQLHTKLVKLHDFVETHFTEAAHMQRNSDAHKTWAQFFSVNPVWLFNNTARKLDPHWEGKWRIHAFPGLVTYVIHDDKRYRTVHVNCLRRCDQPDLESTLS